VATGEHAPDDAQPDDPAPADRITVLGSSAAIPKATPTKHSGGSIFDTLEGNVLERTVPGQ
jgi:hypothetical protein